MCTSPLYKKNENYMGPWQERYFQIPCGKCEECQRKIQNDWFVRAKIELSTSVAAFFCTLTYNDLYLPVANDFVSVPVLCKKDLSDFFKRLKNYFVISDDGKKKYVPIKYLACGEYGGQTGRPHYHFILFIPDGYFDAIREDFIDEIREKVSKAWSTELVDDKGCKLIDGNGHIIRQAFGDTKVDYSNDHRIRYVVKYMLKGQFCEGQELIPSFRLVSHGLGLRGFNSDIKDLDHLCFSDDGGCSYGLPRYLRDKVFEKNTRLKFQFKLREAQRQRDFADLRRRYVSQHSSNLRNKSNKKDL